MRSVDFPGYLHQIQLRRDSIPSYQNYPFNIPALNKLDILELHPEVTFFVGENGSGKSTLIEAIAVCLGLNPEGGGRNFNFTTRASHSQLGEFLRPVRGVKRPKDDFFLRAESFFNVATEIEHLKVGRAYGKQSLHERSHGESFIDLLSKRFFGNGLYLLDEPEAALSPTAQLSALRLIHEIVQDQSQFIICTHSPILMAYPNSIIYLLADEGIEKIQYEATEHFITTKSFLQNPTKMIKELLYT